LKGVNVEDGPIWRGRHPEFVRAISSQLGAMIQAENAVVGVVRNGPSLVFSIADGTTELRLVTTAAGVDVSRRLNADVVDRSVTLSQFAAGHVRAACQSLLDKIQARGTELVPPD